MTLRRAAVRLRETSSIPLLLAALLLAASSSLTAQDRSRSRPSDSGDSPRTAVPRSGNSGGDSGPAMTPPSSGGSRSSGDEPRARAPRTAVPSSPGDGEAHRQRPHNRRGDDDRGYYDPYRRYYRPYYGRYYGPYWSGFWADLMFGWYYDYDDWYWRSGYYGPGYRDHYRQDRYGALDLDVHPGRTEVYIDGRFYGKVDAYDGFPQYLWLPRGTYDVVFYLDGYQTLARQISVSPGMVIDIDDRMAPGESKRPEDLASKSHERRDERLRYERERRERLERGEPADEDERDDDWRDRGRRRDRRYENDADREERREERDELSESRGRLRLDIEPDDASVYLDGRFVGTAEELSGLRRGLPVDAGEHHLSVVRPGHRPAERDFEVGEGEEVEIEIELESGAR